MKRLLYFAAFLWLFAAASCYAQHTTALVVSSCGSAQGIAAANAGFVTVDTSGRTCVSGSGSQSIATGQATVGTSATLIAAARPGRNAITITNTSTAAVYLGASGVTTATGTLLPGTVGASVTLNTSAAIYGVVATGTEPVTEFETY